MPDHPPIAIGLDLGSTRIKAASLHVDGTLSDIHAVDAPSLRRDGLIVEGDPEAYLKAVGHAFEPFRNIEAPIGLSTQRSTLVIWEKTTGKPMSPMISWQDRRAEMWCRGHEDFAEEVFECTGLPLSPHYFGPKLACILEERPEWREQMEAGRLVCSTLDAFLCARWTRGNRFLTDTTMAGRTQVMDLATGTWSGFMADLFNLPLCSLPSLGKSRCDPIPLEGLRGSLTAMLADQPSAMQGLGFSRPGRFLVNIGTGMFVLKSCDSLTRVPGFLTGPCYADQSVTRYALEGTVNGGGATLARFGEGEIQAVTGLEDVFCMPDESGLGAPFWRPAARLRFSKSTLSSVQQRLLVAEALVFRGVDIIERMGRNPGEPVLLSGGLASSPFIQQGFSSLLGGGVSVSNEVEASLRGAALVAANRDDFPVASTMIPHHSNISLNAKFQRWKEWMADYKSP